MKKAKNIRKRVVAFALVMVLAVTAFGSGKTMVSAEKVDEDTPAENLLDLEEEKPEMGLQGEQTGAQRAELTVTETYVSNWELPDNDKLFADYVEKKLYGVSDDDIGTSGSEELKGLNLALYNTLKTKILNFANGVENTTEFSVRVSELQLEEGLAWTAEELGIADGAAGDIEAAVSEKLKEIGYDFDQVLDYLLADCRYAL